MIEEDDNDEIGLCELRQKAKEYYSTGGDAYGVMQKMEEALNSMFYDKPADTFGHLATYFETFAKTPVISKLRGCEVFDCRTLPTVGVQVYCEIRGKPKLVSTFVSSTSSATDGLRPEERDEFEAELHESVESATALIEGAIKDSLVGLEPVDQERVDNMLLDLLASLEAAEMERLEAEKSAEESVHEHELSAAVVSPESPGRSKAKSAQPSPQQPPAKGGKGSKGPAVVIIPDEPAEKLYPGCEALSAVSQVVCKAGAVLSERQLYEHIAMQCRAGDVPEGTEKPLPESFRLPLPMVTMMVCGRGSPAKLKCVKEFMVVPSPQMPLAIAIKNIEKIYNHCFKSISAGGAKGASSSGRGNQFRLTNDTGALCPLFERPEQGLDLLQEAITGLGLSPGVDFHLAINCAAQEIMDFDKGKYETATGQQKTSEELTKFWLELVPRYPSLIAIIDPLRKQDSELWMQLAEAISPKCYVVGDFVYHRPGRLRREEPTPGFQTSAVVLYVNQPTTVTDVLECAHKMKEAGNEIVIGCGQGETTDSFAVDLAVGCGAKFLKVGGATRGERVSKFNRLLEIDDRLQQLVQADIWSEHVFTAIHVPPPPPPVDAPAAAEGSPTASAQSAAVKKSPRKQK